MSIACASVEDQAKEKCDAITKALGHKHFDKAEEFAYEFLDWYYELEIDDQVAVEQVVIGYNNSELIGILGFDDVVVEAKRGETFVETAKCINLKMIYVEGGTFAMGSNSGESDEKPIHNVTLDSYYIGETEITQAQWRAVMGSNPSAYKGDNRPVEKVSWNDAKEFCKKLSELTGKRYVLPTEAQWEYAARGGNQSKGYTYSGSNNIDEVAIYDVYSSKHSNVKSKKPNELGIYDMSGNVWEWCSDWYSSSYSSSSQTNPQGPTSGSYRVLRGGSWGGIAGSCRVAYRDYDYPSNAFNNYGFRVVCLP